MEDTETRQATETPYSHPMSQLLTLGEHAARTREWPDYVDLGLAPEHVPELIRMTTDPELNWADSDSLKVWAPIHAWRALGQLRAAEAVEPLITLFEELEENDWAMDELPEVFGMIGPPAIPALARYLTDPANDDEPKITAAHSLERIGSTHPETRDECVAVLTKQLERFRENDPGLNGFLISFLVDLKAAESIDLIRRAFQSKQVDLFITGDLEDAEIELGLRQDRSTPADYSPWYPLPPVNPRAAAPAAGAKKKVGRNEPCPCGSGKKYKKCCLNRAA